MIARSIVALMILTGFYGPSPMSDDGGIRGTVVKVSPSEDRDAVGLMMLDAGTRGRPTDAVTITTDTVIEIRRDGKLARARFSDLAEGQVVHAWSTGAIMKSFPAQWTAKRIVIEE